MGSLSKLGEEGDSEERGVVSRLPFGIERDMIELLGRNFMGKGMEMGSEAHTNDGSTTASMTCSVVTQAYILSR